MLFIIYTALHLRITAKPAVKQVLFFAYKTNEFYAAFYNKPEMIKPKIMLGKLGAFARSLENLSEHTNETQDYSLMTYEKKRHTRRNLGFSPSKLDIISQKKIYWP